MLMFSWCICALCQSKAQRLCSSAWMWEWKVYPAHYPQGACFCSCLCPDGVWFTKHSLPTVNWFVFSHLNCTCQLLGRLFFFFFPLDLCLSFLAGILVWLLFLRFLPIWVLMAGAVWLQRHTGFVPPLQILLWKLVCQEALWAVLTLVTFSWSLKPLSLMLMVGATCLISV